MLKIVSSGKPPQEVTDGLVSEAEFLARDMEVGMINMTKYRYEVEVNHVNRILLALKTRETSDKLLPIYHLRELSTSVMYNGQSQSIRLVQLAFGIPGGDITIFVRHRQTKSEMSHGISTILASWLSGIDVIDIWDGLKANRVYHHPSGYTFARKFRDFRFSHYASFGEWSRSIKRTPKPKLTIGQLYVIS